MLGEETLVEVVDDTAAEVALVIDVEVSRNCTGHNPHFRRRRIAPEAAVAVGEVLGEEGLVVHRHFFSEAEERLSGQEEVLSVDPCSFLGWEE